MWTPDSFRTLSCSHNIWNEKHEYKPGHQSCHWLLYIIQQFFCRSRPWKVGFTISTVCCFTWKRNSKPSGNGIAKCLKQNYVIQLYHWHRKLITENGEAFKDWVGSIELTLANMTAQAAEFVIHLGHRGYALLLVYLLSSQDEYKMVDLNGMQRGLTTTAWKLVMNILYCWSWQDWWYINTPVS